MKVVNAENKILGRLASHVADELRNGEEVRVVNSEKAVISGDKEKVLEDYKQKKDRGARDRGPYFPKRPDRIFKRTVKGMLPSGPEGRDQLSNMKAYLENPLDEEVEEVDVREGDDLRNRNYVKLGEVSKFIGWKPAGETQ
jgi:large subunit ribosomal protein L13